MMEAQALAEGVPHRPDIVGAARGAYNLSGNMAESAALPRRRP